MNSDEALRRIERRHETLEYGQKKRWCGRCYRWVDGECREVKLARALAEILKDSGGSYSPINRGLDSIQQAECVLAEVAGEEE